MKKTIALILVALAAASCSQTEKGASIGAVSGAIIGGAVTAMCAVPLSAQPSVVFRVP